MNSLDSIEERLVRVDARNRDVELNKAWEISFTRRVLIILFTYFSIAAYLKYLVGIDPWINAIVPALGFLLSTQSLQLFKKLWKKYIYANE